jgi:hypothetical protein
MRWTLSAGFVVAFNVAACVSPMYAQITPGVAHEDVIYAFEVDSQKGADDTVKVVVCHRFGNPPCVSMRAEILSDTEEYARWRAEAARRNRAAQQHGHTSAGQDGTRGEPSSESDE